MRNQLTEVVLFQQRHQCSGVIRIDCLCFAASLRTGADDAEVRGRLLEDFDIEIGAGLGVFKGKIWRIGLMGTNSTRRNVITFLGALEDILVSQGAKISAGVALDAASSVYR